MESTFNYKEVFFDQYCKTCKFYGTEEFRDPCNECLENPMNENSHRPINWKEKE